MCTRIIWSLWHTCVKVREPLSGVQFPYFYKFRHKFGVGKLGQQVLLLPETSCQSRELFNSKKRKKKEMFEHT